MQIYEDAMSLLRTRLQRLEEHAAPAPHTGAIRIIQNGELTPEQKRQIADAKAQGKMVILRVFVQPGHAGIFPGNITVHKKEAYGKH